MSNTLQAKRTFPLAMVASLLAFLIGLFYLFAITPLSVPDEAYHYSRAYGLSSYILFQWDDPSVGEAADFDYRDLAGHQNVSSAYDRIKAELFAPGEPKEPAAIPFAGDFGYFITSLPPAIGIAFGRLTNQNFIRTFYLGRLCNLLFYSVMLYFTVKRAPKFKMLLILTALLPMSLHQAASYSYDTFINALAFFLIASLLRSIYGEGALSRKDYLCVLLSGMLLAPAKMVYTPILLLFLLIPAERYKTKKNYLFGIGILFFCAAAFLLVFSRTFFFPSGGSAEPAVNWEGGYNYTLSFIFQNPVQTVRIFLNTLRVNIYNYIDTCIGYSLSGLSLPLPMRIIRAFRFLLLLSALLYEKGTCRLGWKCRTLLTVIVCASGGAVMLSMFLGWTSNTRDVIQGVQGRYFLPILPLAMMLFNSKLTVTKRDTAIFYLIAATLLHAAVITEVIQYTLLH